MRILHSRRRSVLTRSVIGAGVLAALVGSFGAGACTVFDTEPFDTFDASAGGSSGSGGEDSGPTGPWWEKTNAKGCRKATPPLPTDRPDQGKESDSKPEFYLAMSFIRLGATGPAFPENPKDSRHLAENLTAFKEIGFDLDDACSGSTTCTERSQDGAVMNVQERGLCIPPGAALDGTNCRDNAVGNTIPISYSAGTTSSQFGVNEGDWNCELHRGGFGVLFRISNYNYTADDPGVTLDVYNSSGIFSQQRWQCRGGIDDPDIAANKGVVIGNWRQQPGWLETNASSQWRVPTSNWDHDDNPTSDTLPKAKIHTEEAFVKEGYLVAHLPPHSVVGFVGNNSVIPGIRLTIERGVLAGRLSYDAATQRWSLTEATLGGAVTPESMLQSFEQIGYCENNLCGSYRLVKTVLTGSTDTLVDPSVGDASQPCDAMSIGMAIEAQQANGRNFIKEDDEFDGRCPKPRHPDVPYEGCICDPPPASIPRCNQDGGTDAGNGDGG